jgi:hypothetical protein
VKSPYICALIGSPGLRFWVPDFIVGTSDAFVVGVESRMFEEIKAEDRRGTLLMQGWHPLGIIVCLVCARSNSITKRNERGSELRHLSSQSTAASNWLRQRYIAGEIINPIFATDAPWYDDISSIR